MAKDKRSRRDILRDEQIAFIEKQIANRKEENEGYMDKVRFNDDTIKVLEDQIKNIKAMCEKQDDGYLQKDKVHSAGSKSGSKGD